jgi:ElaB/YqjD/DUF883 family membrane-anchored ribosome-binding protein
MTEGILKKTIATGAKVADVGVEAARIKETVEHAVEDGIIAARRAAKHGRYAAEDLVDEATHYVKQNPLSAVAISFWAGLGLGALAVWLASHNRKDR